MDSITPDSKFILENGHTLQLRGYFLQCLHCRAFYASIEQGALSMDCEALWVSYPLIGRLDGGYGVRKFVAGVSGLISGLFGYTYLFEHHMYKDPLGVDSVVQVLAIIVSICIMLLIWPHEE